MNKSILIIAAAAVIAAAAFYGGMKYAENKGGTGQFSPADFMNLSSEERQQRFNELGADIGGFRGGAAGGQRASGTGFTTGEIIAKDEASITVKLLDGGSRIVYISDTTEITKFAEALLDDLDIGANVMVGGEVNSDGSVTAQSIQLRPALSPQQ